MRSLGSANDSEITQNGVYPVDFAEIIVVPGNAALELRLSTLYKSLTVDGNTYDGAGHLLEIGSVADTLEAKSGSINFTLTGLDIAVVGAVEDARFVGAPITLRRGFFNETTGALVGEPYIVWRGIANDYSVSIGNNIGMENRVTINVNAKSLLTAILESENGRFTSPQGIADDSMDFVASLTSFNPQFGRE